jgi:hypothetical protein
MSPPCGGIAIVENDADDATLSGSWTASTYEPNYFGSGYMHDGNANKGTKTATWSVPSAGTYQVSMWWTAAANRASNIPVSIASLNGGWWTTVVTVDQKANGAQWNLIGVYTFDGAGTVSVGTAGTDGYVIVDGIRFRASGQCTSSRTDGFCAKTCGVCTGSGCVDVQPGTSSYTQHANKNCHSSSGISTWSDGSDAGYSTTGRTVDECKAICATYHDTCAGFTFVRSTGTCEWKSAVSLVANALQLNGVPLTPDRPDTVGTAYSDDGNGVLETSSSAVHNAWSARGAALVLYAPMPAEPWAAAVRVRMSSGAHQALRHGLEKSGCQRSPPACLWRRIRGAGCQGLGSRLPRRA